LTTPIEVADKVSVKAPALLSRDGCDRSTAYHQANKIVRADDGLYVTWLDAAYRCLVARVSPKGKVLGQVVLAQGYDNHCGGTLARTPDGALHFLSGSHHVSFVYRHTRTPGAAESWSPPQAVATRGTYPSFVADPSGNLHLACRQMGAGETEPWGVACYEHRPPDPWARWGIQLLRMPAPLYSYPTNALAAGADGTLHLLVEWYKTWPGKGAPARSLGVSHFERSATGAWLRGDGSEVGSFPTGMEGSPLILSRPSGNPRPGNIAVLRDGQPCFGAWDQGDGSLLLAVRDRSRVWRVTDLSGDGARIDPGNIFSGQPQVAVNAAGEIVLVAPRAATAKWGDPSSRLHAFWLDLADGSVRRHHALEKTEPGEPDWLASIEKPGPGVFPEELYLLFQTGQRGEGCINAKRCAVNLAVLP
jgi:hypothetical protein